MRELLARMDSRELTEWMAFYGVEPFGDERSDIRAALVAQTVANVHRGKRRRPYKLDEFVPKFERRQRRQSSSEMMSVLRGLFGE